MADDAVIVAEGLRKSFTAGARQVMALDGISLRVRPAAVTGLIGPDGAGKTVIQHIYDSHFEGADEAARFLDLWRELEGLIEDEAFGRVEKRLIHQKEHAKEWRDVVNSYFYRISGIEDEKGRPLY